LGYTQIIQGNYYQSLGVHNCIRVVPVEPSRGRILDRNGVALADTRVSFNVMVVPQEIKDKEKLFFFLGGVLKIDNEKLLSLFKRRTVAFFAPVIVAEDVPREIAIIVEENKFRFPGLFIQICSKRSYPFKEAGAHVLGYVGRINKERMETLKEYGYTTEGMTGYTGVEEYYDRFLRGQEGGVQIEVDSRGQQMRLLGMRAAAVGQDVMTTLDARIQQIAQKIIAAKKGVVIVMNLETGEVLGMVSSPSFDPNVFLDDAASETRASYFKDPRYVLFNRAIQGRYPPGSVFKIPIAIAALQTKKLTKNSTFFCDGSYNVGRWVFRCSHVHGAQNFTQAIAHSCNVYFFNTGLVLGPKILEEYARLFGLGTATGIDLPYEEKGNIPKPDGFLKRKWSKGDTLNFSIGQGDLLVTPLELVRMMATVANNGKECSPYVMKNIGKTQEHKDVPARSINISQSVFDQVKEGMRAAVTDEGGTARVLAIKDIVVSGKTGTAQAPGGKDHHAWFVGYCPQAKMKIVFCVFLENGGSSYNACRIAADLLKEMKEQRIL
ncbi:MAG: penicillin-binding protein 2, partial [Candidatus Omnitrophota bacterium]|jgi:penicillin-binding protein 2